MQKLATEFFLIFEGYSPFMARSFFTEEFCQPENLHPLLMTRQIQDIRVGILTIVKNGNDILICIIR
jgi:hypothetical protein